MRLLIGSVSRRGARIVGLAVACLMGWAAVCFGAQTGSAASRGQQFGSVAVTIGMSEFDAISRLSEDFSVARVPGMPGLLMIRSKQSAEDSVGAITIRNGRVVSITSEWTPMVDRAGALGDVLFSLLSRFTTRKQDGWRLASGCSIAATDTVTAALAPSARMIEIACDRQTIRLSMSPRNGGSHVEVALVVE